MSTLMVPGNLLLFGEYAVLEQGGLGLACAVAPYVRAHSSPAKRFSLEGQLGVRSVSWHPGEEADELLPRAARFLEAELQRRGTELAGLKRRVVIDSSDFVDLAGAKRGFGSSAAATVALCRILCELAGIEEEQERFELAVQAHRAAQGGRGSGYDVAASFFGGFGLFRGGDRPEFTPLEPAWMPPVSLLETGAPASTQQAVSRYTAWKTGCREEAREFLERSNGLIASLVGLESWTDARPVVGELARLGIWLGEQIGVPARGPAGVPQAGGGDADRGTQAGHDNRICKAVGAGAELFVCFGPEGQGRGDMQVRIDREGCTWR